MSQACSIDLNKFYIWQQSEEEGVRIDFQIAQRLADVRLMIEFNATNKLRCKVSIYVTNWIINYLQSTSTKQRRGFDLYE